MSVAAAEPPFPNTYRDGSQRTGYCALLSNSTATVHDRSAVGYELAGTTLGAAAISEVLGKDALHE